MVDLNIDKSNWQLISFGDVAIQKKGRVDRESTTLTRYVKGEHMGSEDIHLREWGELDDEYLGPAFHRRFDEGDILYGSRRTYLKKVCIAPFAGITSNTTFVVEANEEFLDKRLLPFIMLSEGFTKHSIQHSKGSVNPYINWKDLANYEFLLPPKDEQAEIAELLWALDNSEEAIKLTHECTRIVRDSLFNQRLFISGSDVTEMSLNDVLVHVQYGISESLSETGDTPVLRMNNVSNGEVKLSDLKYFEFSADEEEKYLLNRGDILFNRTNSFELVGKSGLFDSDEKCSFASYLLRLVCDEAMVRPDYLAFYLSTKRGLHEIHRFRSPGVSQSNINAKDLRRVKTPVIGLDEQARLMTEIEAFNSALSNEIDVLDGFSALKSSTLNQIFC